MVTLYKVILLFPSFSFSLTSSFLRCVVLIYFLHMYILFNFPFDLSITSLLFFLFLSFFVFHNLWSALLARANSSATPSAGQNSREKTLHDKKYLDSPAPTAASGELRVAKLSPHWLNRVEKESEVLGKEGIDPTSPFHMPKKGVKALLCK